MKPYTDQELRELDIWIYRNVPGLKTCRCVNGIKPKFGAVEYQKIRKYFLKEGSKDVWPEIEPDLPCDHQSIFHSDPAASMQVLEKCHELCCVETGEYGDVHQSKMGYFARSEYRDIIAEAPTLSLAICLFSKSLFSK